MQEKTLFYIALSSSFLGILGIFILSFFVHYDLFAIQDIHPEKVGDKVRIEVQIISFSSFGEQYHLIIEDETGKIPILFYSSDSLSFQKNSFVEVVGTISEYECTLQITAEKITL